MRRQRAATNAPRGAMPAFGSAKFEKYYPQAW